MAPKEIKFNELNEILNAKVLYVDYAFGGPLEKIAPRMIALAAKVDKVVVFEFNTISLGVNKKSDWEKVCTTYVRLSEKKYGPVTR